MSVGWWRATLSRNLQELRFHYNAEAATHRGVVNFLSSNYADLKELNPGLPMLVRPSALAPARIYARYDFGKELHCDVDGLDEKQILDKVRELVRIGEKQPRSAESEAPKDNVVRF
eukprot:TRINITY_DN13157_c0_g1_i1.p2 TRINITY_DN13157_c0_g1~~TRINITY_DN13157_c0_g1_i1.p2  ORF type:complete len:116 (-),score=27.87 TRINITY_DN13157_c0_g1_i1:232-579(-)